MLNSEKLKKKGKSQDESINVEYSCIIINEYKDKIDETLNNIKKSRPDLNLKYYYEKSVEPDMAIKNILFKLYVKISFNDVPDTLDELCYKINLISMISMFIRGYIYQDQSKTISVVIHFPTKKTTILSDKVKDYAKQQEYAKIITAEDKYHKIHFNYDQYINVTEDYTEFEIEGAVLEGLTFDGMIYHVTNEIFCFKQTCIGGVKAN